MKKIQKTIIKLDDKIFFIKNDDMRKKCFLKSFNVKNKSYLYQLYGRLYDYIIGDGINLYEEFEKYYSKEYSSFEIFLSEHYNIPDELVEKFNNTKSYYKYKDIGNEQPLYNLLHDEEVHNIVSEFMGGYVYEN